MAKFPALFCSFLALPLSASPAVAGTFTANWTYTVKVVKGSGPPPTDLASRAIAAAAQAVGVVTVATGTDAGNFDGKRFGLNSNLVGSNIFVVVDSNLNFTRQSQGLMDRATLQTMRYTDKRGSTPTMEFTALPAQKLLRFNDGKGGVRTEPMTTPVVDMAVFPYTFVGLPAPKTAQRIALTDGKSVFQLVLTPRPEPWQVKGRALPVVRLSGSAGGATLELWVRESDSFPVKVRLGVSDKYGAILDQDIVALPEATLTR